MALPAAKEARLYYRAAKQRFDDAQLLLEYGRTTGAVYLAGYTAECFLKALVLARIPAKIRGKVFVGFRGHWAHNVVLIYEELYLKKGGTAMPKGVRLHFWRLAQWSTDLRYETRMLKKREADDFMASVVEFAKWADGRL